MNRKGTPVLAGGPEEKCLFARPNYVLSVALRLSGKTCTGKESLRNLWVIWLNGAAPPKRFWRRSTVTSTLRHEAGQVATADLNGEDPHGKLFSTCMERF